MLVYNNLNCSKENLLHKAREKVGDLVPASKVADAENDRPDFDWLFFGTDSSQVTITDSIVAMKISRPYLYGT